MSLCFIWMARGRVKGVESKALKVVLEKKG